MLIFLTSLIPNDYYNEFCEKSRLRMVEASNALQWRLINGFCKNESPSGIRVINILPIGSYPGYYPEIKIKEMNLFHEGSLLGKSVGFINLRYYKQFSVRNRLFRQLQAYVHEVPNDEILQILAYGNNPAFAWALNKIKKQHRRVITCSIIEDLPIYESLVHQNSFSLRSAMLEHFRKRQMASLQKIDSFVLLTKQMADALKITDKPFCICEGIALDTSPDTEERKAENRIVYCGSLHKQFGVCDLIDAFVRLNRKDYELQICGDGDSVEYLRAICKKHSNVKYLGVISHNETLLLERHARAVVNPRNNSGVYTKYSFPSKNLEALSLGVLLLAYKLEGIPDEYDQYIQYIGSKELPDLEKSLNWAMTEDPAILSSRERTAQDFVLRNKNEVAQTRKILNLLEEVSKC